MILSSSSWINIVRLVNNIKQEYFSQMN